MAVILFLSLSFAFGVCCLFSHAEAEDQKGIDYLALVNKLHPLNPSWEKELKTVTVLNSVGDEVEVELKAFAAYSRLKADLEANDRIFIELDSARRTVAAQQAIMESFTEKYGTDYAAKTVAEPGCSEHHTGLALDLYFRIQRADGSFVDVYHNEDMEKAEYRHIWNAIHAKLADYGFILRYLPGKEHITGYRYEPWHIRYLDSPDIAGKIMPGLTLEEYLTGREAPEPVIALRFSAIYSEADLHEAVLAVKCRFAALAGCELRAVRYAGDRERGKEIPDRLNALGSGKYSAVMELLTDFQTADGAIDPFEPNRMYTDFPWLLGRLSDGGWEVVSIGDG